METIEIVLIIGTGLAIIAGFVYEIRRDRFDTNILLEFAQRLVAVEQAVQSLMDSSSSADEKTNRCSGCGR